MGYDSIVVALVRQGADATLRDRQGKTAEDLANVGAHQDILFILQNGRMPSKKADQIASQRGSGQNGPELLQAA